MDLTLTLQRKLVIKIPRFSKFISVIFKEIYNTRETQSCDLIQVTRHLCTRSRIDGIKAMSRSISGGKQVIKFAYTSNCIQVCLLCQNKTTISLSCKMYISSFGKNYILTVYHEDIYSRYCIQKSSNDHFHPYFDFIVFKMTRCSFPVV